MRPGSTRLPSAAAWLLGFCQARDALMLVSGGLRDHLWTVHQKEYPAGADWRLQLA